MYRVIEYPFDPVLIHLINAALFSLNVKKNNFLFPEEIENMPTIFKETECGICLTVKNKSKKLKCKHLFCEKCISKWLTNFSNSCPVCRTILN